MEPERAFIAQGGLISVASCCFPVGRGCVLLTPPSSPLPPTSKFVMGMSFILLLLTFKHLSQRYRQAAATFWLAEGPLGRQHRCRQCSAEADCQSHRCRRLVFLKALGPLTVCIISIALMNIFKWWVAEHACASPSPVPCLGQPPQPVLVLAAVAAARCLTTVCACGFWWLRYQDYTGVVVTSDGKEKQQKAIANIGSIPSGALP